MSAKQFVLNKNRTFTKTVTIFEPNDKDGHDKSQLTAEYKIVPVDELKEATGKTLLDMVLVGVPSVPVPEGVSSEEVLEAIKMDPCAGPALIREYNEAVGGKNLKRSS